MTKTSYLITHFHKVETLTWLRTRTYLCELLVARLKAGRECFTYHLSDFDFETLRDFMEQMDTAYLHPRRDAAHIRLCQTIYGQGGVTSVDLGLPSGAKWAPMNVGASAPEEAGKYFSWGNTDGHTPGDGYEFTETAYNNTPGAEISGNIPISQDAARVNMGGSWRMPTKEELVELFNYLYTTNEWVDNYMGSGINGCLVTSKVNGNKLFFPAAGYFDEKGLHDDAIGDYWSASFNNEQLGFYFYFDDDDIYPNESDQRFYGYPVRAVQ